MSFIEISGKELNINLTGDGLGLNGMQQGNEEEIVTDEQLFRIHAKVHEEKFSILRYVKKSMKESCRCSSQKATNIVHSVLPITKWLPEYKVRQDLLNDIASGITVGIVHLPQGMAYSILAGLPPIHGLYVSFFPVLMYALFGTTRHLSVGTFAVVALMVAEAISKHVPACPDGEATTISMMNTSATSLNTSIPMSLCEEQALARRVEIAVSLCVAVAIIHLVMYAFRLGILYVYLPSHMVSAFTCGAAFHVLTSQVPNLLGIRIPRKSGILSIIYTYVELFTNITFINWATVIISFCNIVFLVVGKYINRRYSEKLPFPVPWELAVVVLSTVASQFAFLNPNYGVIVVGEIPQGIRTSLVIPSDIGLVFSDAIPISIVTFSISISLSLLFSEKHAYTVDSNQELLAYVFANFVGSFFQCFPCCASLSRSLVWEQSGGRSQLTGLVSTVLILVTLLWIGPLFEQLPQAALAAIIAVNLKNLLTQFTKLKPLWKVSKIDVVTWVVTWTSVFLLGVDLGLYIGVGFSLFTVVLRTQITFGDRMVAVGRENTYRSSRRFDGEEDVDILIFKFPSPLIYANQLRFKHQLSEALNFNPVFENAIRKKMKEAEEAAEKARKRKLKRRGSKLANINAISTEIGNSPVPSIEPHAADGVDSNRAAIVLGTVIENPIAANFESGPPVLPGALTDRRMNREASDRITTNGIKMPLYVILDMSICSFIDNDGVILMKTILTNFAQLNIRLLLARCTADVRRCLLSGGFPVSDETSDDSPLFIISLDKAVKYAKGRINDYYRVQTQTMQSARSSPMVQTRRNSVEDSAL